MSLTNVKIFHDGSHFIAKLASPYVFRKARGSAYQNSEYEQFKLFEKGE